MQKILVVGQTPPPFGGQALMIQYMLDADYKGVELYHIRMNFSREMNERGKISLHKVTHMISIVYRTYKLKFKNGIDTLYYPPSNSPKISIYRDAVYLILTRFLFKNVIFHFHAAGISEVLPTMNWLERKLIKLAFNKPNLAITSSEFNPPDGKFLNSIDNRVIPLGIPDSFPIKKYNNLKGASTKEFKILFIGLLNSTKGEGYLLDAIAKLYKDGFKIKLLLAGKFESEIYKRNFYDKIEEHELTGYVEYLGVITGQNKINAFLEADLFCFPSFFESESFGIVLLEAMQFSLPIISTRWRGIQSIVKEGENGFLVNIKNSSELADKIEIMINNTELRREFGEKSRELYLKNYTSEKYKDSLEIAFKSLKN